MAEAALNMSLDDLIKKNKTGTGGKPRGRGRGGASGPGPARRFPNRSANRAAPYSTAKAPEAAWNHDMFAAADQAFPFGQAGGGQAASSISTGTKLYISNLDYGVSNEDIKELFSEAGDLKRYAIHYDRSGRSKGTAEVVFSRRQDALAAVKRYNNVQLDGKPMKIEIVGANIATPAAPAFNGAFGFGDANGGPRSGQARGGGFGRSRGGRGRGRGFRGGSRGRGRGDRGEKVSAEDLDADLMKYHSEAMQTN
ncbi:PREDICTED: THO complex subunit 4A-like [Nicotiana attenuata]|uniref:THO complex subunit 4A-like n=1 Tax=Nicotiana attenuata TaxID=49451 RepID=UPI000905212A|nr:PREDICTED: THO complex subunit 4A-like [Nicotiana attenuata]